jgi:hypothetical protein
MLAHAGAWPEERARHEAGLCAVALVEDDPVLAAEHLARGEATGALPADIAANLAQRIALAAGDPAAASGPDPDLCARALAADGHTLAATALARDPELIAELAAGRGCAQQAREALDQVAAPPRWLVARVLAAQGRLGDARAALELRAGDPVEAASTAILLGDIRESTLEVGAATLDAALSRRPEALRARWLARWADLGGGPAPGMVAATLAAAPPPTPSAGARAAGRRRHGRVGAPSAPLADHPARGAARAAGPSPRPGGRPVAPGSRGSPRRRPPHRAP